MYKQYDKYKDSGVEWIGEIPEHWRVNKLKRLALIVTGNTPPKVDDDNYSDEGIQWIKPDNILDGGKVTSSKERLSAIGLSKARLIPPGSALVCCIGTVGRIGINLESVTTNQQINSVIFNMKEVYNNNYGYFCLVVSKKELEKYANKVVVPILNKDNQGNIFFPLPYYTEQQEISLFLNKITSDIDSLIADKEELIKKLEDYKQSIITEAVTKGLNPNVKMKDSGVEWIGEIPEHWEINKLQYSGFCQNGVSQSADYFGIGYPFVSYGDVYQNFELPIQVEKLANATTNDRELYSVCEGDVFFTRTSETVEEIGIVSTCMKTIKDATFSGFLIRFRPKKQLLHKHFSKYYFRSQMHRRYFVKEMNLVTRASLSQGLLKRLPIIVPPLEEQIIIAEYLDELLTEVNPSIDNINKQIDLAKDYRQSLIFEAVTGKIDVRDSQLERSEQFA